MSNASDFFVTGGGSNFALGITPPALSTSFKEPGNTSWADAILIDSDIPVDKGRVAPIFGETYKALAIPIKVDTNEGIAVGPWPSGGPIWLNQIVAGAYDGYNFKGAYYYDKSTNYLYSLHGSLTGISVDSIFRTDLSDGTVTLIHKTLPFDFNSTSSRLIMEPELPNDPENGDWYIYYQSPTDSDFSARVITSSGDITVASKFRVDKAGSNQPFRHNGGYISADNTTILGNISLNELGSTAYLSFTITRGPSTVRVALPNDGSAPSTFETDINVVTRSIAPLVWGGDTVIVLSTLSLSIYGRRILDRADFDRWINEIADFYGLPAGEDFSPQLTGLSITSLDTIDSFSAVQSGVGGLEFDPVERCRTIAINNQETRVYAATVEDDLIQVNLATRGDISSSSASAVSSFNLPQYSFGVAASGDELSIYIATRTNNEVRKYTRSSTTGFSTLTFQDSFSIVSQTGAVASCAVTPDETSLYITGGAVIYKYDFGTPGIMSSLSFAGSIDISNFVGITENQINDMVITADETSLIIAGNVEGHREFFFGTAGDITTLTPGNLGSITYNDALAGNEILSSIYSYGEFNRYTSKYIRGVI